MSYKPAYYNEIEPNAAQALRHVAADTLAVAVAGQDALVELVAAGVKVEDSSGRAGEPVAWMESPHGALRANPAYRLELAPQTLSWALPLYTQTHIDGAVEMERLRWIGRCRFLSFCQASGDYDLVLERLKEWLLG